MAVFSTGTGSAGITATTMTLTPRYEFITVSNNTGVELWARSDGVAATVDGDMCVAVPPASDVVIANMLPLWEQAQSVIPNGANNQWGQWKGGGVANPGTSVSVITAVAPTVATPTVTIQGAG